MKFNFYSLITFFLFSFFVVPQSYTQDKDVLFTVDGIPVYVDEFEYIYKKNNGDKADYSRSSVEEYLDLYIKFKLKVQKARQLKLDTIKALQDELAGYRKQLAKSYLVDKELLSGLVDELYERKQKDIRVSHLLLKVNENASSAEVQSVLERIKKIRVKIEQGADFKLITQTLSDDKASAPSGGNLGWMTAMLPDGFYAFENAIYNLEIGEVSQPVRSPLGFHLLKVTDTRKARGEIEVAHILVRSKRRGQYIEESKSRIDSIYGLLQNGASFETLAAQFSEDKNNAAKGGYLGYFGISQYDIIFENIAFSIPSDNQYSRPIQTAIGWHIIKRLNKKDYSDTQQFKNSLTSQVSKSDRFEIATKAMVERIKEESNFTYNAKALKLFSENLDKSFYSYKWELPPYNKMILCSFGENNDYTLSDFAEYCKKNTRKRMQYNKETPLEEAVEDFYKDFLDEKAIEYEEVMLEQKYPDFKSLMREYSEGILLFEATKINVWDKAPKDTLGLRKYYEANKEKYAWKERGVLNVFTIKSTDQVLLNNIFNRIRRNSAEDVLVSFNQTQQVVQYETTSHERDSREFLDLEWKKGAVSRPKIFANSKNAEIRKIEEILPPRIKTMNEARGYIIADYQDELESQWVEDLRNNFEVKINEQVLDTFIKKS